MEISSPDFHKSLCLLGLGRGETRGSFTFTMETLLATAALGIIAKYLEFKLESHIKAENDYVAVEELNTYTMKNVETF